jgi:hypothetical protein
MVLGWPLYVKAKHIVKIGEACDINGRTKG